MFSLKEMSGQNRTLTVATMTLSWVGTFDGVMAGFHSNGCWRFGPQWESTMRTN